ASVSAAVADCRAELGPRLCAPLASTRAAARSIRSPALARWLRFLRLPSARDDAPPARVLGAYRPKPYRDLRLLDRQTGAWARWRTHSNRVRALHGCQ